MNKLLLDTHALVWLAAGVKLGPQTLRHISEADVVLVSALSIFELRLKAATGKFPEAEVIISSISTMSLEVLNFTEWHTEAYKIFNSLNKDPYDNALVSVAIAESVPLVTADRVILSLKIKGLRSVSASA
ncbi:MAG TPA: PIN domain-containing protein [Verrucomicrobiae bacterium]|nr:PIN domain-containing protein [Verrucomicrobiae bacterium]